jgi:glycosyltransferase involved in cell wall biosynthesis
MNGGRHKLYVECTTTYRYDNRTGIPRVVRNVIRHLRPLAAARGYDLVPVHFANGKLYPVPLTDTGELASLEKSLRANLRDHARRHVHRLARALPSGRLSTWLQAPAPEPGLAQFARSAAARLRRLGHSPVPAAGQVDFDAGDVLLLFDVSLEVEMAATLEELRRLGVRTGALVYDLIPLQHPEWWPSSFRVAFGNWLDVVVRHVDLLVAISHSVALDLERFRSTLAPGRRAPNQAIAWFHLGHDLDPIQDDVTIRPSLRALFASGGPVLLNVGWIDPRKNQLVLFDALTRLSDSGLQARLLLVGKLGIGSGPILERLERDAALASMVTVIHDLSDAELDFALRSSRALVYPSLAEGFGLPLVEALSRGLPAFVSDIPVFRELAGEFAVFFDPSDPEQMAAQLSAFLRDGSYPVLRPQAEFHWPTWQESVTMLMDRLMCHLPP